MSRMSRLLRCLSLRAMIQVGIVFATGSLLQGADWTQAQEMKPRAGIHRPVSLQDMIEVNTPTELAISPDGRWVSYVLRKAVIEDNHYLRDVYVVPADGSMPARQITHNQPRSGFWASAETISAVWAPTSDKLVYVGHRGDKAELRSIDVKNGKEEVLISAQMLGGKLNLSPAPYSGPTIAYSPDGRTLAFLASQSAKSPPAAEPSHAIEAGEDWAPDTDESGAASPVAQLFAFDLKTHQLRTITPPEFNISRFAWSPDGQRFALEAEADPGIGMLYMRGDIYVVDVAGEKLQPLVQADGLDRSPVWSPDGKQIAFCTQHGRPDWIQTCSLAVVAADGRTPPRDLGTEIDKIAGASLNSIHWVNDGRDIDVQTRYYLSEHLFRVSTADGKSRRLSLRDDRLYDEVSYSRDGKLMALRIQGVGVPPDVYISPVETFRPQALTHLNPSWDTLSLPRTEIVQWRSLDNRWDIRGLLVKPSTYDPKRRYPMLTAINGGPSMVTQEINPDSSYPVLAMAEQGYVIFMPNSRGRRGLGLDFAHAIRDERSYVLHPETDVFAGVDAMVTRGIADPERLGVMGFSYGGTLTAYAITLTDRFKAAIYGEGMPNIFGWYDYPSALGLGMLNDMWGFDNPYEPKFIASALEQSSLFHLDRVHTPVLVEAGEKSGWKTDRTYYRGLRHFGVPAEFYVYPRSGHGWDEPQLMQESFQREISWFDYWIEDKPYPDAAKQRVYDAWKQNHGMRPVARIEPTM